MFLKLIIALFIIITGAKLKACDEWFKDLKIKNIDSCISKCVTGKTDMSTYLCTSQCDQLCKDFENKLSKQPNFYDLTDDELLICKNDPLLCVEVYSYTHSAENKCSEIYSVSDHNDESDACRHYMWSYYLVKNFGIKKARKILNAHEANPKQPVKEKEMDTFNNEVALKEYSGKFKNYTDIQAFEKFKENIKSNKFIILKSKQKGITP